MLQTALSNATAALQAAKDGNSTKPASASQDIIYSVENAALSITDAFGKTDQRHQIIPSPGSLQQSFESGSGNFLVPVQKNIPNISIGKPDKSNVVSKSKDLIKAVDLPPPKMPVDSIDVPGELQMSDSNSNTQTESTIGKKDSPTKSKKVPSKNGKNHQFCWIKTTKVPVLLPKN